MKIFEIFGKKVFKWSHEDSFDVWISADGQVIDLGADSSHLSYVQDKYNKINDTGLLVKTGWVKITNTGKSVEVTGLYDALKRFKKLWMDPILEKSKHAPIVVKLNLVGKETLHFNLPKDSGAFIALL
jgi:hypothetical protein